MILGITYRTLQVLRMINLWYWLENYEIALIYILISIFVPIKIGLVVALCSSSSICSGQNANLFVCAIYNSPIAWLPGIWHSPFFISILATGVQRPRWVCRTANKTAATAVVFVVPVTMSTTWSYNRRIYISIWDLPPPPKISSVFEF